MRSRVRCVINEYHDEFVLRSIHFKSTYRFPALMRTALLVHAPLHRVWIANAFGEPVVGEQEPRRMVQSKQTRTIALCRRRLGTLHAGISGPSHLQNSATVASTRVRQFRRRRSASKVVCIVAPLANMNGYYAFYDIHKKSPPRMPGTHFNAYTKSCTLQSMLV